MRMLKLPDGRIRLLVQGLARARIDSVLSEEPYLKAKITRLEEPASPDELPPEHEALLRSVKQNLEKSVSLGKNISPEVMVIAANLDDPARLADLAASNLDLKLEDAQKILESTDAIERLRLVNDSLAKEITVLTMQQEISSQARGEMDKSQREYYLRQQLRAIQQELGEGEEISEELDALPQDHRRQEDPPGGGDRDREADQAARAEPPRLGRNRDHPDLPRLDDGPAVGQPLGGLEGHRTGPQDPRRGPLRHREGQGAHPRVPGGARPEEEPEGPDPLLRRAAGRRQDLARPLDRRARSTASSCASRSAACATRPRSAATGAPTSAPCPAASSRASTRPDLEPRLHARRDRQDRRRLPRRPVLRPARGARPGAELLLPRPLPRRALRPLEASSSSRPPTCSTRSSRPSSTAWRSSASPATRSRRRRRSPGGTSSRSRWRRTASPRPTSSSPTAGIEKIIEAYTREAGLRNLEREIGAVCRKVAVSVAKGKRRKYRISGPSVEKMLGPIKHFRRRAPEEGPGRRRHRARLDLRRRRHPLHRGPRRARQGRPAPDRTARRRHEGVGAGRDVLRAGPRRRALGIPDDFFETHDVHVHVPEGSIPEGRAVGRHHDGDRDDLGLHAAQGRAATWP